MIKAIIALVLAIPTYGVSILVWIGYILISNKSSNEPRGNHDGTGGGLLATKDDYYIGRLASIENQLKNGDDFYGAWLDNERESLLRDVAHPLPNVILGLIYMVGINTNIDADKAEKFFKKSIELDSPFAHKYLAVLENGRGNRARGTEHMEKAIQLGDSEAMQMLGVYYVHEITLEGKEPDFKRARELFSMAAKLGHDGAKQNLHQMNLRGV